jgi:hypothetical protein
MKHSSRWPLIPALVQVLTYVSNSGSEQPDKPGWKLAFYDDFDDKAMEVDCVRVYQQARQPKD